MRQFTLLLLKLIFILFWYFLANTLAAKAALSVFSLPAAEPHADFFVRVLLVAVIELAALIWLARSLAVAKFKAAVLLFLFYHLTKYALMLIEALFYLNLWNSPSIISVSELLGLEVMGLVCSVMVCPMVAVMFVKSGGNHLVGLDHSPAVNKVLTGAVIYMCCYLFAGALILMPLAGDSFIGSYANLSVPVWMPLLQIARGAVWVWIIGFLLSCVSDTSYRYSAALISTCLVVFSTAQLLIPNSQMPAELQNSHIVELVLSMAVFGVLTSRLYLYPAASKLV